MINNPIPEDLKSNHLVLLVGTNPLPDWVATQLLLKDDGQLYLVHSRKTWESAERLSKYLLSQKYRQPNYVDVKNPYVAAEITTAIKNVLRTIKSGSIGINYTGGTKIMSVHTYRAFEKNCPEELKPVVFSYLEAPTSTMRFDNHPGYPGGKKFNVGLVEEVKIDLEGLVNLHGDLWLNKPDKDFKAKQVFDNLVAVHGKSEGQRAWRRNCFSFRYNQEDAKKDRRKKANEIKSNEDLRPVELNPQFAKIIQSLTPVGMSGKLTLGDIADKNHLDFISARELAEWLDGKWLEHYVLEQIIKVANECGLNDYGRNIRTWLSEQKMQREEDYFEADVGAIRGYQLHLISCYSGNDKKTCKQKLFEVFTRVRQLGGDETRAALVCCSDDPGAVEDDVGQAWDIRDRVKVFGRSSLWSLSKELADWFKTGAQE